MAVKNDSGLKSLFRKVHFGVVTGSSFQRLSWSSLCLRLSNQEARVLVETKPYLDHRAGTLFMKMAYMRSSIFSVMVSSPLKASSISARAVTMTLMRTFMYSHSWRNVF